MVNLFWKLISIVAILLIYYQNIAFPRGELKTIEICRIFKAVIFQIFICVYARPKGSLFLPQDKYNVSAYKERKIKC